MAEKNIKFLDKLEEEALDMLQNFKEHPVKSIFVAIFILWGVKKIYSLIKGE